MKQMLLTTVETAMLLGVNVSAAQFACAADLPTEFTGVWILADTQDNQCQKNDWKGDGTFPSDRYINITRHVLEMWESGCKIVSVRARKSYFEDRKTVFIELSCSGEGMTWRQQDVWHIQNIDRRRMLVMTTTKISELLDDSGKRRASEEAESVGNVSIYLECK